MNTLSPVATLPAALPPEIAERKRLRAAFWAAALIAVVLPHLPFGRLALYPFALLATWSHEMGHGLTAILVGGRFDRLLLFPDLGGVAYSARPDTLMANSAIAAGGLLGPAIAGGLVVALGARPRLSRMVLWALAGFLLFSLLAWVRNPFGMAAVLGLGLGFGVVARWGSDAVKLVVTQLTGIQLSLGSLSNFDYMFTRDFVRDGRVQISDTQAIAQQLLLPYWFWGGLIAALSLLILWAAFWTAWVRPARAAR